ncbi:MAG: Metallophosphoesterase [uncultured bacterium]|nr:MAG: Metallophosphoesterase [uncultured bacterium]
MYDFIGDIHGHADELRALLEKLGYRQTGGVYRHPARKVFFTGDFIDRGPKIRETLQIVKGMIDHEQALTVMGNHEFNAVCYNMSIEPDGFLRKHSEKNVKQHAETLRQFSSCQSEYEAYVRWFRTLPLFYEGEGFRVVHACWDARHVKEIARALPFYSGDSGLTDEFFTAACAKGTEFYTVVQDTLKGKEVMLPEGIRFEDKDGHKRSEVRIRWWLDPLGKPWKEMSIHHDPALPDDHVEPGAIKSADHYAEHEIPVFFGHYWYTGCPQILRNNVCCLDYSVAKQGKLVAYRFNGEKALTNDNFVHVDNNPAKLP